MQKQVVLFTREGELSFQSYNTKLLHNNVI